MQKVASYHADYNSIIKNGFIQLVFELKLWVFLAGHIVAIVTYCATQLTAICSLMIGQFVDIMILASTDKEEVIMTHQSVGLMESTGNCFQPP